MSSWAFPNDLSLPWNTGVIEDVRFRRMLVHAVGIFTAIAILFPFLPRLEIISTEPVKKERSSFARLVIEEKKLAPPPVVKKPEPAAKPEPAPKVKKPAAQKKVQETPKAAPAPKPKPVDLTKQAREKAAKSGVLAFADDLAAMRQNVDVSKVKASDIKRGSAEATRSQRKLLTAKASASVGGIASTQLSSDTGGVALSARETTIVEAASGDIAEWSGEETAASGDYSGRSSASVRRVMDANKGAVYSIYNRALRNDPGLAGKLVFNMTIESSGAVSAIELVSSELGDEALVKKILARIRMINFGAEPVTQTNVNYSFDFLPY